MGLFGLKGVAACSCRVVHGVAANTTKTLLRIIMHAGLEEICQLCMNKARFSQLHFWHLLMYNATLTVRMQGPFSRRFRSSLKSGCTTATRCSMICPGRRLRHHQQRRPRMAPLPLQAWMLPRRLEPHHSCSLLLPAQTEVAAQLASANLTPIRSVRSATCQGGAGWRSSSRQAAMPAAAALPLQAAHLP